MPDFVLMIKALAVASIAAGIIRALIAWPRQDDCPRWRLNAAWILSLAAGVYAGCAVTGDLPRWPPLEDRARFLIVLLPLLLVTEASALSVKLWWLAWLFRAAVAVAAAPILLHRSIYLADLSGSGSALWSRLEAVTILGGLAAILTAVWGLLSRLEHRCPKENILAPVLVLSLLAASVTVMHSGYYRAGLFALPITGALAGASVAGLFGQQPVNQTPALAVGVVGLFSILLIGRYFGSLSADLAIGLFAAPLFTWVIEIPALHRLSLWKRITLQLLTVIVLLALIVLVAQRRFSEALKRRSQPSAISAATSLARVVAVRKNGHIVAQPS